MMKPPFLSSNSLELIFFANNLSYSQTGQTGCCYILTFFERLPLHWNAIWRSCKQKENREWKIRKQEKERIK